MTNGSVHDLYRYKSNSSLLMSDALVQPSSTCRTVTVSNVISIETLSRNFVQNSEFKNSLMFIEHQCSFVFDDVFVIDVFQAPQSLQCGVCLQVVRRDSLLALPCQHSFCKACWEQHCTVLVKDGIGVGE